MDQQRFNAVRNGDSFNCPICDRARSLVLIQRAGAIWQCGNARVDGCFTTFRLEARAGWEVDTLVRLQPEAPTRQSPEEFAARRRRFL